MAGNQIPQASAATKLPDEYSESESETENHFPRLHEQFLVFSCYFGIIKERDCAFTTFFNRIVGREINEIHSFVREQSDNPSGQNCVFLSLTSFPSTFIILNEESGGFTANVCSQEKPHADKALEWISRLAEDLGYVLEKVNEKESVKKLERATAVSKTVQNCASAEKHGVQKDKVLLPSGISKKVREIWAYFNEMFKSCACGENEKSESEAYEPANKNDENTTGESPRKSDQSSSDSDSLAFQANVNQDSKQGSDGVRRNSNEADTEGGPEPRFNQAERLYPANTVPTVSSPWESLLQFIARSLQFEEVTKLKHWAKKKFDMCAVLEEKTPSQILQEFDERNVISSTNLEEIRVFFQDILRFDLVHMIDCFVEGDYSLFMTGVSCPQNGNDNAGARAQRLEREEDQEMSEVLANSNHSSNASRQPQGISKKRGAAKTPMKKANFSSRKPADQFGSNGKKLSKLSSSQQSNHGNHDDEGPWLCSHYKRRCNIRFDCCDQYWPCHRCHNNQSKCGEKKLKSRDTTSIKCTQCGTEQQFDESSQYCLKCNLKFANYFCAQCKHLTGNDDFPYHCTKCGICRIHGDRSFHCDVCGVCLDIKLQNNHKCRAGSAHDECCICLEDAFTGCQILPCSHKVHKECATLMLRSGITRCPICRESFADRLEKRTTSNPMKKSEKH